MLLGALDRTIMPWLSIAGSPSDISAGERPAMRRGNSAVTPLAETLRILANTSER
jgi:hypothetical protein